MLRAIRAFLTACLLLVACGTPGGLRHSDIPPLRGQVAAFDQALLDQVAHRLYLADDTLLAVDVFDVSKAQPRFIGIVPLGHKPHGFALAADLQKLFVGIDGGSVAVLEIDPKARKVDSLLPTITTTATKNVDLLDYDPVGHILWAASSDDGILSKIDAIRNLVVAHLDLPAGLEQPRFDPADHMLYLPNQIKNLLYQVDPANLAVTHQWSLGVPCSPTGMAIDSIRRVAMLGCADAAVAYTLEWNLAAGRVARTFSDVGSADQVIYDRATDSYLVAGTSSGTTAIGFYGGSPVAYRSLKLTHADSRAVAFDPKSGLVYTPDAHPGEEGLVSFPLPAPASPAPPFVAPLVYLMPFLVVGLVVWYFGRKRERERRLAGRPMFS